MSDTYSPPMEGSRISALGSALSDPTRAATIAALLSGTAHTSGELARACGVAASTMSGHLSKLIDAGLVEVEPSGRHRHYRIASREVAELLERIDSIELPETSAPARPRPGASISYARSCYDHIAGHLGVQLHNVFLDREWVVVDGTTPELTDAGARFVADDIGLDLDRLRSLRRPLLRIDLDWTERRDHLAGSMPAALMTHMLDNRWLTRRNEKRVLVVTETGRTKLDEHFGITGPSW